MAREHDTPLLSTEFPRVNLLAQIDSEAVQWKVRYLNKWLNQKAPQVGPLPPEKRRFVEMSLNEPMEFRLKREAIVTGYVMGTDQGILQGEPESVVDKPYIFGGLTMLPASSEGFLYIPVAVLEDSDSTYYALPSELSKLEMEHPLERMGDVIIDLGNAAKHHVNGKKFSEALLADQVTQLRDIEQEVNRELQPLEGLMVELETTSFIGKYDGMDWPLNETVTRNSEDLHDPDESAVAPVAPYGKFVRALYVELEEYGEAIAPHITLSELTHGVPCIELRDDLLQATYYVPMNEVETASFGPKARSWWPAW